MIFTFAARVIIAYPYKKKKTLRFSCSLDRFKYTAQHQLNWHIRVKKKKEEKDNIQAETVANA